MARFPYVKSENTISVFVEGTPYQTDKSNPNWASIIGMLNDPSTTSDQLINAVKPIGAIQAVLRGEVDVQIVGGDVLVNGTVIHSFLAQRVLDIVAEGLDPAPWVAFVKNVFANPFTEAQDELYGWLEKAEMPITVDGCFLAFKVVDTDFLDRHSRTFDNSLGKVVSMPREECDNNSRALCSKGLHFCSKDYLPQFGVGDGDHVMIVKVNPADVVSVPRNETAKGRTWRYEVVGEITQEHAGITKWAPIDTTWDVPEVEDVEDIDSYTVEADGSTVTFDGPLGDVPTVTDLDNPDVTGEGNLPSTTATVTIKTKQFGDMSFETFTALLESSGGTVAEMARSLGIPAGTVGKWKAYFRKLGITA